MKSTLPATTIESKSNLSFVPSETDLLATTNETQTRSYMLVLPSTLSFVDVRHPNSTNSNIGPRLPLTFVIQPTAANNNLNITSAKIQTKPQNILTTRVLPTLNFYSTSGVTPENVVNENICTIPRLTSNEQVLGGYPVVPLTNSGISIASAPNITTLPYTQSPITSTTLLHQQKPATIASIESNVSRQGSATVSQITPTSSQVLTATTSVNSDQPAVYYKNPFNYSTYKMEGVVPDLETKVDTESNEKPKEKSKPSQQFYEWACMICCEVHENKESLLAHYEFHKEEKDKLAAKNSNAELYKCPACPKQFNSLDAYKRHVQNIHGDEEFSCTICNKYYSDAYALSIHNSQKHSSHLNIYNCCVCKSYQTKFSRSLRQHIKLNHSNNAVYKCEICEKVFTSLAWLNDHKICHSDKVAYPCKICKKKYASSGSLINHNRKHHVSASETTKYECESCHLNFANKKALLKHSDSHATESGLCFVCGKIFGSGKILKTHLKLHTDSKKFVCNVCGRCFLRNSTLVDHLRTHSGEKPYKCKTCGKCFSQRTPLVVHQRLHTGEKPYVCPTCNKGYVSNGAFSIHRKTCR